ISLIRGLRMLSLAAMSGIGGVPHGHEIPRDADLEPIRPHPHHGGGFGALVTPGAGLGGLPEMPQIERHGDFLGRMHVMAGTAAGGAEAAVVIGWAAPGGAQIANPSVPEPGMISPPGRFLDGPQLAPPPAPELAALTAGWAGAPTLAERLPPEAAKVLEALE